MGVHTETNHENAAVHTETHHANAAVHTETNHANAAVHTETHHENAAVHTETHHATNAAVHTDVPATEYHANLPMKDVKDETSVQVKIPSNGFITPDSIPLELPKVENHADLFLKNAAAH